MEIWKDVKGYEGRYQVSNIGRIKSIRFSKHKILKMSKNTHGYFQVKLCTNGDNNTQRVHRLEAVAFLPNPKNKRCVNHIDGNKANNELKNLEWATHSENTLHAFKIGLKIGSATGRFGKDHNRSKSVLQYSLNGEFIAEYGSTKEAVRVNEFKSNHISECCSGKYEYAHGYKWKYKNN